MARMPYPQADVAQVEHPLNLFRMLAHSPAVGRSFERLGASLLGESSLSPRLRELAILRIGLKAGATYEVGKHLTIARWVGVTEQEILALQSGSSVDAFGIVEQAVLQLADELEEGARASDALFARLREHLSPAALVELVVTIGFYQMVGRVLETFGVDGEVEQEAGARAV